MKTKSSPAGGDISLAYSGRLPLSTSTINHVASLIRAHRKKIRSRWRTLNDGRIAVIVLAHLRNDEDYSGKHKAARPALPRLDRCEGAALVDLLSPSRRV